MNVSDYFTTARERYLIRLRRETGQLPPWTDDPVFQKYRFCNVHREHDKTTEWFRENVRSHLDGLNVVRATLIFRWFNRIETGEIIKDLLLHGWDSDEARRRLRDVRPLVTGAYMIRTESDMSKLDGLLFWIDRALPKLPSLVDKWGSSIEEATRDLVNAVHGLGPFLAYEITTDLRWTPVLCDADDILTWANVGPGATHGLGRLFDNPYRWKRGRPEHQAEMVGTMQDLLRRSRFEEYWPQDWTPWEMREVEHWACEYDKWSRGREDQKLKRRFRIELPEVAAESTS